jgi:hypothetical protein
MASSLDQLYETKTRLVAVLLAFVGVALMSFSKWPVVADVVATFPIPVPFGEVGSGLFAIGVLGYFIDYQLRRVDDRRTRQGLREAVRAEAPAIRDAVLDSLAFNAKTLKGVTSDEQLDHIATNALALRLDDDELARELYTDLRDQVLTAPERWHDVKVAITLRPWATGPATGKGSMFVAAIRWEYRVKPSGSTMRFACVSDKTEYRELLRDEATTSAWYHGQASGLDASDPEVFQLTAFTVDGKPRKIRRTERVGAQVYAVSLGPNIGADQEVTVAYTYRGLVQRHGHLLYLDLPRPAKGLHVQLDYEHAGIRWMNTQEYFASSRTPRIEQADTAKDAQVVNIGFDGWVLPRAGVDFVWVLEDETQP